MKRTTPRLPVGALRLALLLLGVTGSARIAAQAPHPERIYLSGTGIDDTRQWEFRCSDGANSGRWSRIAVPCNWELQGFGDYTYGRWYTVKGAQPSREEGHYRHRFAAPKQWRGERVLLWFDGVMTDAEVLINGQPAGEPHRGGFYRFGYDITPLLRFGGQNLLEVKVAKHSANKSVNRAERMADWWLFGGIYRPVWLEVVPERHVRHLQLHADAEGWLSLRAETEGDMTGCTLRSSLRSLADGTPLRTETGEETYTERMAEHRDFTFSQSCWPGAKLWTPETPNLYTARIALCDPSGREVQVREIRTGFRTVEFFPNDGIYLNGTKLVMKGINRHSFSVDGGRATSAALSRQDAELIRGMNMNAVRSHYPPDEHFLDMCDSLGLLYIDELAGWHDAYDTQTGSRLLREMIERDVNHPCIVLWANGNEGGWNTRLDTLFARYDALQRRHVIHPWADFDELDTHHYPAYQTGVGRFTTGYKVFLPTEFMHAMYDQGGGAGLRDFWERWQTSPLFAGGFIWAFCDEAPKRTDRGGSLDSDGSNAPDGVVGPRREKEGSYYAIREQWSPVQLQPLLITPHFDGSFRVTNEFLYTNLSECRMTYRVMMDYAYNDGPSMRASGTVTLPAVAPGETGTARFQLPKDFFMGSYLELEAFAPDGRSLCTWSYPIRLAKNRYRSRNQAKIVDRQGSIHFHPNAGPSPFISFDARTGLITQYKGKTVSPDDSLNLARRAKMAEFDAQRNRFWLSGPEHRVTGHYHAYYRDGDSICWDEPINGMLLDLLMANPEVRQTEDTFEISNFDWHVAFDARTGRIRSWKYEYFKSGENEEIYQEWDQRAKAVFQHYIDNPSLDKKLGLEELKQIEAEYRPKLISHFEEFPMTDGPIPVGMKMIFLPEQSSVRVDGRDAVFCARYRGGVDSIVWRLGDHGLCMDAVLLNRGSGGGGFDDAFMDSEVYNLGFSFSYPEEACSGMKWLGRGPYRVWKNRLAGSRFGLWHNDYNDTVTGESYDNLIYPEFKGYYGDIHWAKIESPTFPLTITSETDGLYLRLFTPREPAGGGGRTMPAFPEGDISLLLDIPAIRSFKPIEQQGPHSQPGNIRIKKGDEGLRIRVQFHPGTPQSTRSDEDETE